jgi:hypothetical protein
MAWGLRIGWLPSGSSGGVTGATTMTWDGIVMQWNGVDMVWS